MAPETQTSETSSDTDALEARFQEFSKNAVSVVAMATPEKNSKSDQIMDFLTGTIRNPKFIYEKQSGVTEASVEEYRAAGQAVLTQHAIPEKLQDTYEKSVARMVKRGELGLAMRRYNEEKTPEAADEYMRLNIELYGAPDETTYRSLLQDKVADISAKPLSDSADRMYKELLALLPESVVNGQKIERFKPSVETIEWVKQVVDALYGNMIRHVPETDEPINASQLRDIFELIIREEFGEAASDWKVELEDRDSTYVDVKTKKILIPINRKPLDSLGVKKLAVHEIGIHMLRSLMGGETDIGPLEYGLDGYLDDDEGLAKVVEQAVTGEFVEAGVDHYITAGLAHFDKKDFRDAFEIKWRLKLLQDLQPDEEVTPEQVQRARMSAVDGSANATLRTFRGTDELPLFISLSYYNGSVNVWKYLEDIRGDDLQLSLLLAGSISTSKAHQRVVLESRSRDSSVV